MSASAPSSIATTGIPTDAQWKSMQTIVLLRLHAKWDNLSAKDKNKPFFHIQDPDTLESVTLSPNDIIAEVSALTDIGKAYISATILLINRLQP